MTFEDLYMIVMSEMQYMNVVWVIITIALAVLSFVFYRKAKSLERDMDEIFKIVEDNNQYYEDKFYVLSRDLDMIEINSKKN